MADCIDSRAPRRTRITYEDAGVRDSRCTTAVASAAAKLRFDGRLLDVKQLCVAWRYGGRAALFSRRTRHLHSTRTLPSAT